MSGLDLGKQIGPMPLGAWLAVVGTGLGIALWTRNADSGPATVTTDGTGGGGLDTAGGGIPEDYVGVGGGGSYVYTGGGSSGAGTETNDTSGDVAGSPTDNDAWGRLAINYLIAQNYNAATAQSAITHALQGQTMSVTEYALWTVALMKLGAPPYAVDVTPPAAVPPPVTTTPPPPPTPTPTKTGKWYVWSLYASLYRVSNRFYGTDRRWDDIWRANSIYVHRPDGSKGFMTNEDRGTPSRVLSKYVGKRTYIPA